MSELDEFPGPDRPRRNRKSSVIRSLVRETDLTADRLIYPLFIQEGETSDDLESLPGQRRLCLEDLVEEVRGARSEGVGSFVLFPSIDPSLKSPRAEEASNPDGLVPRAIRAIKEADPGAVVITDVALDPYSSDGHDGLLAPDGRILNDDTIDVLVEQALCQARAGADIIAPSDMMDGRVGAIRAVLDADGHEEVSILSYAAKYASAFYGPFRGALDSSPRSGDKKTYQMDPANRREALREVELDEDEGADMILVKPAGPYLDVIAKVREATLLPLAAYQVSGEYLALKAASSSGWLDERAVVLESLTGIRRAGADMILTYYARQAARWLN